MKSILLRTFHRLPDGVKLHLRSYKRTERELDIICSVVQPKSLVVDIGANKGAYTYKLARCVGSGGRVVAIEPVTELADSLMRAVHQLRLPVDVHVCCLSDFNGTARLNIPIEGGEKQYGIASLEHRQANALEYREVSVQTLDDLLRDRDRPVAFIKCDVEGHELAVFTGANQVLSKDRPILLVEIEQRHIDKPIQHQFNFFDSFGYIAYYLDNQMRLQPISQVPVSELQSGRILSQEHYINNFLFLHKKKINDYKSLIGS